MVHGKKTIIDKLWGSYAEKCAQLRTLYFYMYTHPGKKLNFMGNELHTSGSGTKSGSWTGICWNTPSTMPSRSTLPL